MASAESTFYEVLGVKRTAGAQDIEQAYVRLREAMREHADARQAARVKVAYSTLSDPAARAEYDESIGNTPKPVRVGDLLLWGAGAAVVLALAMFAYRWHDNRALAAAAEDGVDARRLVMDVGRRVGRVETAFVSGQVRDVGLAVEVGPHEMAAACGEAAAGATYTVAQGKDTMRAELANAADGICILGVRGGREGIRLRTNIPAIGETLYGIVLEADGAKAREVVVKRIVDGPRGPTIALESGRPLPNGTPLFDLREQLVALVASAPDMAAGSVVALPASRIAAARESRAGR